MTKRLTGLCIAVITASLFLQSCIDKSYNLDNVNKDAVFPVGNIPLGNVNSLRIDSILDERTETKFIYDSQGYITLNYGGGY
ncbi:MAG: hypothetical protein LUE93_16520 [Bacteroides sp.]|nr:hypothetical protein [Bacteroides sp.]